MAALSKKVCYIDEKFIIIKKDAVSHFLDILNSTDIVIDPKI